jgi:hypothetical protein
MWKQIDETNYEISSDGQVKNILTQKVLKQHVKNGYYTCCIMISGKRSTFLVHRKVAIIYIPNLGMKSCVNHINGNKLDNRLENLEWCTHKENSQHSLRAGLTKINTRKIIQKDTEGNIIASYNSLKEITEKFGYDRSSIIRVCKKIQKTAYKYIWDYADATNSISIPKGMVFEDYDNYLIDKDGNIFSQKTQRILKPIKTEAGYTYATLVKNGYKRNFYIHYLVGILYVPKPENTRIIIHKNGIKDDNRDINLIWVSSYNKPISSKIPSHSEKSCDGPRENLGVRS